DAREDVAMPAPGETAAARLTVRLRDLTWEMLYAPVGGAILFAADQLSHLQFLTIRKYLSLVFALLVILLFFLMLVMLVWS
ncbi:MAG: hydrogenase 4 subunit B, partial [Bradyrhizobium sp.]